MSKFASQCFSVLTFRFFRTFHNFLGIVGIEKNEEARSVQIESDRPYTGVAFNAIRQAMVTGRDSTPIPMTQETRDATRATITEFGAWAVYHLETNPDGKSYFTSNHPEAYVGAADYCKPFIDSLADASDRLTYKAGVSPTPNTVLVSDSVKSGNCMSYAFNFRFLCDMAGIPCVLVQSKTHQWNEVYVDGR